MKGGVWSKGQSGRHIQSGGTEYEIQEFSILSNQNTVLFSLEKYDRITDADFMINDSNVLNTIIISVINYTK